MSLGLLPWEKWLPPYVIGSLLCIGGISVLVFSDDLDGWKPALCVIAAAFGAYGTWIWFKERRNIFDPSATASRNKDQADNNK